MSSGRSGRRYDRVMLITDTHGDQVDPLWLRKAKNFQQEFQPEHTVHLGDYIDATAFRRGASADEQQVELWADVEAGMQLLVDFGVTQAFEGNHDIRVRQKADSGSGGVATEFAKDVLQYMDDTFSNLGITPAPFDARDGIRPIALPNCKLNGIHGLHQNMHCAKKHAELFDEVISGDVHRFSRYVAPGLPRPKVGITIGCGCNLNPSYAYKWTSRLGWQNGWAYGYVDRDTGEYEIWDAVIKGDKVWTPEGVK